MSSEKKAKVTPQQWEMTIRRARQYTRDYARARWIIAELALEVCDYNHGGRKGPATYSLRRFADEIEVERKTLYQWVRVKRLVFDKLPKGVQANAHKYLYSDFDAVSDDVAPDTPPAVVRKRWEQQLKQEPESKKFEKYIKHVGAIIYNASRPMIMKDVKREYIVTMLEKVRLTANLLQKELDFRERYPTKKRELAARVGMKDELARRIAAP